jgi:hypothetical protein
MKVRLKFRLLFFLRSRGSALLPMLSARTSCASRESPLLRIPFSPMCRPPLLSPSTNPVASVLMPPPRRHHPPFSPRDARRVSPDSEVRLHDPTLFSPQSASQSPIANSQPPHTPNSQIQVLGCRRSETLKVLKGGQEPSRWAMKSSIDFPPMIFRFYQFDLDWLVVAGSVAVVQLRLETWRGIDVSDSLQFVESAGSCSLPDGPDQGWLKPDGAH